MRPGPGPRMRGPAGWRMRQPEQNIYWSEAVSSGSGEAGSDP
jgi:hypothetical protein